jgi:3-hydroxybutyryl-CoA dehydrogenase
LIRIKNIAVIGAGVMGHGIALTAAQFGKYEVIVCDTDQQFVDRGMGLISDWLQKSVAKGQIAEREMKETLERIHGTTNLQDAISKADFIIEAVTENKESKKALLREVGKIASDHAIVVTNTSSIRITELAAALTYPENFCGMHFFNPAQLMELVEVTKGKQTSDSTVKAVLEVAHKMGKETVVLKKDCPGFIVNRILMSALNEAVDLYYSGVAEKEDIDKAIKLGLKWPIGPLMLIDQIGVDTVVAIDKILGKEIGPKFYPHPQLKEMSDTGDLGRKSGKGFYDWTNRKMVS